MPGDCSLRRRQVSFVRAYTQIEQAFFSCKNIHTILGVYAYTGLHR